MFIEKISSFLLEKITLNIKTFTSPETITIIFNQGRCNPVCVTNGANIQQSNLYMDCGFNILKRYHNEIGKYLEKKFEDIGLKQSIIINSSSISVNIVYHVNFSEIIKYSKKFSVSDDKS